MRTPRALRRTLLAPPRTAGRRLADTLARWPPKLLEIGGGTNESHHKNMTTELRRLDQKHAGDWLEAVQDK